MTCRPTYLYASDRTMCPAFAAARFFARIGVTAFGEGVFVFVLWCFVSASQARLGPVVESGLAFAWTRAWMVFGMRRELWTRRRRMLLWFCAGAISISACS